jgi:hypothetical protein
LLIVAQRADDQSGCDTEHAQEYRQSDCGLSRAAFSYSGSEAAGLSQTDKQNAKAK